MGTLFGFAVGYILGARAGSQHFEEVVQAAKDLRESAEFRAFIDALREHVRDTARLVSERLADEGAEGLIERARARMRGETPPPSGPAAP